jgi:hypothetical protein
MNKRRLRSACTSWKNLSSRVTHLHRRHLYPLRFSHACAQLVVGREELEYKQAICKTGLGPDLFHYALFYRLAVEWSTN